MKRAFFDGYLKLPIRFIRMVGSENAAFPGCLSRFQLDITAAMANIDVEFTILPPRVGSTGQ